MSTTAKLQLTSNQIALWMSQNPTAARVAMVVVPVIAAMAIALATGTTAYACPAVSSGGGGCGI